MSLKKIFKSIADFLMLLKNSFISTFKTLLTLKKANILVFILILALFISISLTTFYNSKKVYNIVAIMIYFSEIYIFIYLLKIKEYKLRGLKINIYYIIPIAIILGIIVAIVLSILNGFNPYFFLIFTIFGLILGFIVTILNIIGSIILIGFMAINFNTGLFGIIILLTIIIIDNYLHSKKNDKSEITNKET